MQGNAATSQDFSALMRDIGQNARTASRLLAQVDAVVIASALKDAGKALRVQTDYILKENQKDIESGKQKGLSAAMLDRLQLNPARIEAMAKGLDDIATLPDPVGRISADWIRPNGLKIARVSVPIGVLGMIYESRPNVTVDAAALCLKSHNAVILRGGSESFYSSSALLKVMKDAFAKNEIPDAAVIMIPTPDRAMVGEMLKASDYIDVMIPRGGKSLVERVMNEARMPTFLHLDGICHVYIDANANPEIARSVTLNAKMRRTGICGATETLLLDQALDKAVAQDVIKTLIDAGCAVVGDDDAQKLDARIGKATQEDWTTEYLDAKISVRTVKGVKEAVDHINTYGSHHTESIITENQNTANFFLTRVDSAIVMHNASTQFADGGEFGMGAEIGIATGKLHARGPVGVEQLTTYKYVVRGTGQTRPV